MSIEETGNLYYKVLVGDRVMLEVRGFGTALDYMNALWIQQGGKMQTSIIHISPTHSYTVIRNPSRGRSR